MSDRLLGGTKTVPLCERCHGRVHGVNWENHGSLIRAGLQRRKASGKKLGNARSLKTAHKVGAASTRREADAFAVRMLPAINGYIAGGYTMVQTAEKLNEMRVPTMRGAQWYDSTIVRLLQRAKGAKVKAA